MLRGRVIDFEFSCERWHVQYCMSHVKRVGFGCELQVWLDCLNAWMLSLWIEDLVCRIYRHENSQNIAMQAEQVGCAMANNLNSNKTDHFIIFAKIATRLQTFNCIDPPPWQSPLHWTRPGSTWYSHAIILALDKVSLPQRKFATLIKTCRRAVQHARATYTFETFQAQNLRREYRSKSTECEDRYIECA